MSAPVLSENPIRGKKLEYPERLAEHQAANAAAGIDRPSEISLVDLAAEFIEAVSTEREKTYVETMERHLKVRVLPYFGADRLAVEIPRKEVEEFRRALLAGKAPRNSSPRQTRPNGPMKVATVNRHVVTLNRVLNFGGRQGSLEIGETFGIQPSTVSVLGVAYRRQLPSERNTRKNLAGVRKRLGTVS